MYIHLHSLFGWVVLLTKTMSCFLERAHHLLLCVQLQPHFLGAERKSDDKKEVNVKSEDKCLGCFFCNYQLIIY